MHDYLMAKDTEVCDIVLDGTFIPVVEVKDSEITNVFPKTGQQYNEEERNKNEKSYKPKKLLVCEIGVEEYNWISSYESAKAMWDFLRTAHKGTKQIKNQRWTC